MRPIPGILLILSVCSCASKRTVSTTHTRDSLRSVSVSCSYDSVLARLSREESTHETTGMTITWEKTVYDTEAPDTAPRKIKEIIRAKAELTRNKDTEAIEERLLEQTHSAADTTRTESVRLTETRTEKDHRNHARTIVIIVFIFIAVMGFVRLFRNGFS